MFCGPSGQGRDGSAQVVQEGGMRWSGCVATTAGHAAERSSVALRQCWCGLSTVPKFAQRWRGSRPTEQTDLPQRLRPERRGGMLGSLSTSNGFEWIRMEWRYNPKRRHSRIGMLSPIQFETRHAATPSWRLAHLTCPDYGVNLSRACPLRRATDRPTEPQSTSLINGS
jgi:hypothetical protein